MILLDSGDDGLILGLLSASASNKVSYDAGAFGGQTSALSAGILLQLACSAVFARLSARASDSGSGWPQRGGQVM